MNYCKSFVCNFDVRSFFVGRMVLLKTQKVDSFRQQKIARWNSNLIANCMLSVQDLKALFIFNFVVRVQYMFNLSTLPCKHTSWRFSISACMLHLLHIPNIVRFEVASFHSIERNHNLFDISILHWGIHWILHLPFKAIIRKSCLWWFRSLNGWHFGFQLKVRILRFESSENTMKYIKKPKTTHTSISLS